MKGRIRHASWTAQGQRDFRSRWRLFAAILMLAPWWWWKARPSDLYLTEYTAMIIFGPLLVIVGIGFYLLAAVHPRCLCAAVLRRSDDRHLGLSHRGRRARWNRRGPRGGRRDLWHWPARARLRAVGVGSAPDHPALCRARAPSPAIAPRTESRRWRCLRQPGRRSSPSSAQSPSASRRSSASPEWPRPDQPDRAWRGADTITSTAMGRAGSGIPYARALLVVERGVRAGLGVEAHPIIAAVPGVVAGC